MSDPADDQRPKHAAVTERAEGNVVERPAGGPGPDRPPPERTTTRRQPSWASAESSAYGFVETERFQPRECIGEGGMGAVLRAVDRDLEREVAIKVLLDSALDVQGEVERFAQEARTTGQLEHPFIVPVYEFGTHPSGNRFLCMKLVQGETLEAALVSAGSERLNPERLADFLAVFVKVCDAISFAHSRGVIHRDLKPSNVMIGDYGQVYVLDWGLARAPARDGKVPDPERWPSEEPGRIYGTFCYMPPEQLYGQLGRIDERSDVFALGATLYEILTGQVPRSLESVRALLARVPHDHQKLAERLADKRIPPELARVALKAMAEAPEDRYACVNDLKIDIERFLRGTWHLPTRRFPAGSMIVSEGDPGDAAYIISEGTCLVVRREGEREIVLRELHAGDVFGETAIFSNQVRSAGVRAETDVTVRVVTEAVLTNALGLNDWMGVFVKTLASRFREVEERLRRAEQQAAK